MNKLYFRFIRFSLGIEEGKEFLDGSALKNFDWQAFYEFAGQQTLLGIIMDGVQRLPREVAPKQELLMRWFFVSQKLAKQNVILDKATTAIYHKIVSEGYQCCILKGQGNAVLYPNPYIVISKTGYTKHYYAGTERLTPPVPEILLPLLS